MLRKFLNLKLKSKLIVGFSIITFISLISGISTYYTLSTVKEVEQDVDRTADLKSSITDVKFIVAHDLKLLMELITTDNKESLDEFWKQHEVLTKDYVVAYNPLNKLFNSSDWNDNYLSRVHKIKKLVKEVHAYRQDILVPVLSNVYAYRNQQLNIVESGNKNSPMLVAATVQ